MRSANNRLPEVTPDRTRLFRVLFRVPCTVLPSLCEYTPLHCEAITSYARSMRPPHSAGPYFYRSRGVEHCDASSCGRCPLDVFDKSVDRIDLRVGAKIDVYPTA